MVEVAQVGHDCVWGFIGRGELRLALGPLQLLFLDQFEGQLDVVIDACGLSRVEPLILVVLHYLRFSRLALFRN